MRKRIILGSAAAILAVALVTAIVALFFLRQAMGSGGMSMGETNVSYFHSGDRIVLLIWHDAPGPAGSGGESSLFASSANGFFTSADGNRIDWEWKAPKERGGDFQINGKPLDLANGTLLLVSTKGGQVNVTQLDVDLSKVQAKSSAETRKAIEGIAKNEPRVAKFIAEASQK
jgi:hypothetical protein